MVTNADKGILRIPQTTLAASVLGIDQTVSMPLEKAYAGGLGRYVNQQPQVGVAMTYRNVYKKTWNLKATFELQPPDGTKELPAGQPPSIVWRKASEELAQG